MKTTKLLYPFANVMGIFFPVGKLKDGGTCQFASKKCLKECIAIKNGNKKNKIEYKFKKGTYDFFRNETKNVIVRKILTELSESNCNIISWFASGDCPKKLTVKLVSIIKSLNNMDVIQCGFTRNLSLYNYLYRKVEILYGGDHYRFVDNLRILLTVEKKEDIDIIGGNVEDDKILFAVPNYNNGKAEIYTHEFDYDPKCCCYDYNSITRQISKESYNCERCYKNKTGCFTKL